MARKLKRKLRRLLDRLESEKLTEDDRRVLKVLLRGHAELGEAVQSDDMEKAELLVGEIFNRAFPSHRDPSAHD
jgi:hypothetical protein